VSQFELICVLGRALTRHFPKDMRRSIERYSNFVVGFVSGSQEANTLDDETNTLDGVILKSKSNWHAIWTNPSVRVATLLGQELTSG
jgi:hypothetical protein